MTASDNITLEDAQSSNAQTPGVVAPRGCRRDAGDLSSPHSPRGRSLATSRHRAAGPNAEYAYDLPSNAVAAAGECGRRRSEEPFCRRRRLVSVNRAGQCDRRLGRSGGVAV
jgi:hypothetical protein